MEDNRDNLPKPQSVKKYKEGFNEFVGLKSLYENWLNDMV